MGGLGLGGDERLAVALAACWRRKPPSPRAWRRARRGRVRRSWPGLFGAAEHGLGVEHVFLSPIRPPGPVALDLGEIIPIFPRRSSFWPAGRALTRLPSAGLRRRPKFSSAGLAGLLSMASALTASAVSFVNRPAFRLLADCFFRLSLRTYPSFGTSCVAVGLLGASSSFPEGSLFFARAGPYWPDFRGPSFALFRQIAAIGRRPRPPRPRRSTVLRRRRLEALDFHGPPLFRFRLSASCRRWRLHLLLFFNHS